MLTSSPNKHTAEQTSRYIMQSASFIVLMDRVGGMAFITLLQEIPRGAGGTPEDHQVLCISDQCLRHAWNLRSSGPRLLLERGSPASTRVSLCRADAFAHGSSVNKFTSLLDGGNGHCPLVCVRVNGVCVPRSPPPPASSLHTLVVKTDNLLFQNYRWNWV